MRRPLLARGLEELAAWCESEHQRIEWVHPDAGALCCLRLRSDAFDYDEVSRFWNVLPRYDLQLASGETGSARVIASSGWALAICHPSVSDLHCRPFPQPWTRPPHPVRAAHSLSRDADAWHLTTRARGASLTAWSHGTPTTRTGRSMSGAVDQDGNGRSNGDHLRQRQRVATASSPVADERRERGATRRRPAAPTPPAHRYTLTPRLRLIV